MWTSNAVLAALVAGAASAATEDRDVPAFDSVHVASGIRATVSIGPRKPVHLEADKAVLDLIETRVENGTLHIGFKPHSRTFNTGDVFATVQAPELHAVAGSSGAIVRATLTRSGESAVSASSGSQVRVRGVDARQLAVQGSGGAVIEVAGRAEVLELQLSGGSQLDARAFEAVDVNVQGSGGSVAEVRASGKVRGNLSGGSEMHVRGGARTRVATSGGSEISVDD
jgi:hypothetical protein